MNLMLSLGLAVIAGVLIAAQAAMNARLGVYLHSSLLATGVAFSSGLIFILLLLLSFVRSFPTADVIKQVPGYLWFSSGLLSTLALVMLYWLIARVGVAAMISGALAGQLMFSMLAGHFGWFELPSTPINGVKLLGLCAMLLGIVAINKG